MAAVKAKEKPRRRRGTMRFLGRVFARLLEIGVCLGIIGGAGYACYSFASESDYFRIKWISVEGTQVLSEDQIVAASEITADTNILFLKSSAIRERVQALPYVKDCDVFTVFPDTVNIRISEREAVATVVVQNRLFAVDRDGRILRELNLNESQVGPLITDLPVPGAVEPGQTVAEPAFKEALAVWDAFAATDLAKELDVSELAARSENDVSMYFENLPFLVRWGRGGYTQQAERLQVLWRAKGGHLDCSAYLDLRFGRDLICK